jgi:hypothetical protein
MEWPFVFMLNSLQNITENYVNFNKNPCHEKPVFFDSSNRNCHGLQSTSNF